LLGGDVKRLEVSGEATVGELKKLISQIFGEPPYKQKLSADNGSRISLEDESRTLSSYGLHSGSVLWKKNQGSFGNTWILMESGMIYRLVTSSNKSLTNLVEQVGEIGPCLTLGSKERWTCLEKALDSLISFMSLILMVWTNGFSSRGQVA
ncbi:hypothetical protein cypCar_00039111, partial [Cyprinus carpio]